MISKRFVSLLLSLLVFLSFPAFSVSAAEVATATDYGIAPISLDNDVLIMPMSVGALSYGSVAYLGAVSGSVGTVPITNGDVCINPGTVFRYFYVNVGSVLNAGTYSLDIVFYGSPKPAYVIYTINGGNNNYDYVVTEFIQNLGTYKASVNVDIPIDGNYTFSRFMFVYTLDVKNITWTSSDSFKIYSVATPTVTDSSDKGFFSGLFDSIFGWLKNIRDGITSLPSSIASSVSGFFTSLGNTVLGGLTTLGNFIIDGIKGLFVPSEGFFNNLFTRLNNFFSQRLGLLYYPLELFADVVGRFASLGSSPPSIQMPQVEFQGHVLIQASTYNFDVLNADGFSELHRVYLIVVDAIMIVAVLNLIYRKYQEVMTQ